MIQLLIAVLAVVAAVLAGLVIFAAWTAARVERALPPRGKFVDVEGAHIHYWEKGAGPAILLIHGLGGQSGNFAYGLAEKLADEFRVIAIDRPGSGYSTREADAQAQLHEQAALIVKFIRALGLDKPLIVGHSLGGAISLGVALDFPDAVSGLALVAPLTRVPPHVPAPFAPLEIKSKLLRRIIAWTVATPLGMRRGPEVLKAIFAPEAVPADFPIRGGGLLGLRPWSFYNVSTDMMSANADLFRMTERYGSLRVPVAILYGTNDEILDYRAHGEAMQSKIPNLRLQLVPGGHMLPVTQPDVSAEFIRQEARRTIPQAKIATGN